MQILAIKKKNGSLSLLCLGLLLLALSLVFFSTRTEQPETHTCHLFEVFEIIDQVRWAVNF